MGLCADCAWPIRPSHPETIKAASLGWGLDGLVAGPATTETDTRLLWQFERNADPEREPLKLPDDGQWPTTSKDQSSGGNRPAAMRLHQSWHSTCSRAVHRKPASGLKTPDPAGDSRRPAVTSPQSASDRIRFVVWVTRVASRRTRCSWKAEAMSGSSAFMRAKASRLRRQTTASVSATTEAERH